MKKEHKKSIQWFLDAESMIKSLNKQKFHDTNFDLDLILYHILGYLCESYSYIHDKNKFTLNKQKYVSLSEGLKKHRLLQCYKKIKDCYQRLNNKEMFSVYASKYDSLNIIMQKPE